MVSRSSRPRRSRRGQRSGRIIDFAVSGQMSVATSIVEATDNVILNASDLSGTRGVQFVHANIRIADVAGSQFPFQAQLRGPGGGNLAGPVKLCSAVNNLLTLRATQGIDAVPFSSFSSGTTTYLTIVANTLVLPDAPRTFAYSGRVWLRVLDDFTTGGVAP
jgi:hypothetical protein